MKSKSWGALPLGCFSSSPNLPALAGSGSVIAYEEPQQLAKQVERLAECSDVRKLN